MPCPESSLYCWWDSELDRENAEQGLQLSRRNQYVDLKLLKDSLSLLLASHVVSDFRLSLMLIHHSDNPWDPSRLQEDQAPDDLDPYTPTLGDNITFQGLVSNALFTPRGSVGQYSQQG